MSNANLGWLYYKEMYKKGNDNVYIKKIFDKVLQVNEIDNSLKKESSFTLTTTYPGLIIGSGYTHGISSNEDSKMGFYFDYTSGVPTIPGSSIKGTLRSLFGIGEKSNYKEEKHDFICSLLKKEQLNVTALAEEIFEGKKDDKPLSIYKRDKFYEARIIKTAGTILQDDYITPHKDALKNPVPLKIIKIRGGTTFEFSFDLFDTEIEGVKVTAHEKLLLFFELLQFHGLGAKTNVGYGQFEEKSAQKLSTEIKMKQEARAQEREKEQEKQREEQKAQAMQEALSAADTTVQKIEIAIQNIQDTKDIYELLLSYELLAEEKSELMPIMIKKVGNCPENTPKNLKKAKTKWPIKIYELLKS